MDSISVLQKELAEAHTRVAALTNAIEALGGTASGRRKKRFVSAATRKKIGAAQKKRWAKEKGKPA
jgi:hypothetical protein